MKLRSMMLIGIVSVFLVGVVFYLRTFPYSVSKSMCIKCRAVSTTTTRGDVSDVDVVEGDFSEWFRGRFGAHDHVWAWSGSEHIYSGYDKIYACGKQNPVWQFPEEIQKAYYESSSAETLDAFWAVLQGTDQQRKEDFVFRVVNEYLDKQLR